MVSATKRPQRAFQEGEVQDPGLEAVLGDYFDAQEEAKEPTRRLRMSKKALKQMVLDKGLLDRLLDGGELRVGPYVLSAMPLEGGPTEIPEW
ncbi:MAG: hypothetical protein MUP14_03900, partial [Dehalococcoidia bacterium]|nr:hypothetical protein [Dehalococcoidia bacterium]